MAARPSNSPVELSLVIPVYNEAENILPTLKTIEAIGLPAHEILVIYDREEDTTLPVLRAKAKEFPAVRAVRNAHGRGALNAIRTGLAEAKGEGVAVLMADLADDLSALPRMLESLEAGADLVCGSRYMPGGEQRGGPVLKGLMSRAAGLSLHWLAGIPTHDVTNSFKLYRRKVIQEIPVESQGGFEIGMELTVKAHARGFKVTEVPSIWTDRTSGESRFQLWRWLPRYLRWYGYALLHRGPTGSGRA
jgi:glycosyltransferase involved in cell wall biosynthesis